MAKANRAFVICACGARRGAEAPSNGRMCTLIQFALIFMFVTSFIDTSLTWINNPKQWNVTDALGEAEGSNGSYAISNSGDEMSITPAAKKDYWSRTFYTPLLIKSDACGYLHAVPHDSEVTVKIDFEYNPITQFDQAGLLLHLDDDHWMKCGIEYCDGTPRLSVVVCNEFSDWSTQPWGSTSARLRVHKILQSNSIVVEAAPISSTEFQFVRIAHISCSENQLPWKIGPFAAAPMAQKGCTAKFSQFSIGPRESCVHDGDASTMV